MDDIINDWFESSVTIEESSLKVDIDVVFQSIKEAGRHICGIDDDDSSSSSIYEDDDISFDDKVNLCGPDPSIEIRLVHYEHVHSYGNNRAITIRMYNGLNSNLTMMSNVTTDHAAPIFLKEIVPKLVGAGISVDKGSVDTPRSPSYTLYSHPLPQANLMNQVYVERGYLGATMIVLYMLLMTTTSVRFITKLRRSGNKTQLKLAGINNVSYWLGNYISDTVLIILSLLSLVLAIFIGGYSIALLLTDSFLTYLLTGDPIYNYFYMFPPYPGVILVLSILSFSSAIVASSYAFTCLLSDQLSGQLLCMISTVTGGVFLKLFLDRHQGQYVFIKGYFSWVSPSLLSHSPLTYTLCHRYHHALHFLIVCLIYSVLIPRL